MKKQRISAFLLMAFGIFVSLSAAQISENDARAIANSFFAERNLGSVESARLHAKAPVKGTVATQNQVAYYVFNTAEQNAWVIVAGDDLSESVIAYGDEGAFNTNSVPSNVQWWLDQYAEQMAQVKSSGVSHKVRRNASGAKAAVKPMLTCRWDQDSPFNDACPTYNGEHCLTGCVATAMAQVMYYHKWPQRVSALPAYTTTTNSITVNATSATTLNWSAMKDFYVNKETGTSVQAVATLMARCGQAVEMDYGLDASGASGYIADAFTTYFNYSSGTRSVLHDFVGTQEWENIVYGELKAKRPVLFGGSKLSGGHEFVCDGYDGRGLYHFNWDWRGAYNGYFLLTVINPKGGGSGSINGNDGYISGQAIVVGLEPSKTVNEGQALISSVSVGSDYYTRSNTSSDFTGVQVYGGLYNMHGKSQSYYVGWGLYRGDELLEVVAAYYIDPWDYLYGCNMDDELSFGSGLSNGIYRLVPICSYADDTNWVPAYGGDVSYIEATVNGRYLYLTPRGAQGDGDGLLETNYTLNYVAYADVLNPNKTAEVLLNLTNNGTSDHGEIYMKVNGTLSTVALADIAPGETGNVALHFLPTEAASYTLDFYADYGCSVRLGGSTAVVNNAAEASIKITYVSIADMVNKVVDGDVFDFTFKATNNGTSQYDDLISVQLLRKIEDGNGYANYFGAKTIKTTIPVSQSKQLNVVFKELTARDFGVMVHYYSYNNFVRDVYWGYYTLTGNHTEEAMLGDLDGNGLLEVNDVVILAELAMSGGATAEQISIGDFDGSGTIDVNDVVMLAEFVMGS